MLWGGCPGAGSPLVLAAGWAVGWHLCPQTPSNSHTQCPEQGCAWCWWAVVVDKREGRVCGAFWPLPRLNGGTTETCSIRRARCVPQHQSSLAGLPQSHQPRLVMRWGKPDPERTLVLEILSWGTGGRCPRWEQLRRFPSSCWRPGNCRELISLLTGLARAGLS